MEKAKKILKDIMENKKILMIISIIPVLILVLILVINITYSSKEGNEQMNNINKEQVVEGIKINNGLIIEDKGIYNYTATVTNTKDEATKVEGLTLNFYDKDNKKIVTLYGYIGKELGENESTQISASVDKDITGSNRIEIELKK